MKINLINMIKIASILGKIKAMEAKYKETTNRVLLDSCATLFIPEKDIAYWKTLAASLINLLFSIKEDESEEAKLVSVNLWDAVNAFAKGTNAKGGYVKECTIGKIGKDSGILFHTEIIDQYGLWFYESFPKSNRKKWPYGYQNVWNQIVTHEDMIGGKRTLPENQTGALWEPFFPRASIIQKLPASGASLSTPTIGIVEYQINVKNQIVSHEDKNAWGTIYSPYTIDLMGNIGIRWVIDIGVRQDSERWTIDLGPKQGEFEPTYGIVGYHAGDGAWDDKRYFGKVVAKNINMNRRKF